MVKLITHFSLKLIIFLMLNTLFFAGCKETALSVEQIEQLSITLELPNKTKLTSKLAVRQKTQKIGLSGKNSEDFSTSDALLFVYRKMDYRRFWMPDTNFDLDIIFLDGKLKIVAIDRNAKAHPGRKEPPPIYQTPVFYAQYVLEIKAATGVGDSLKIGDEIKWKFSPSLSQIISNIHP